MIGLEPKIDMATQKTILRRCGPKVRGQHSLYRVLMCDGTRQTLAHHLVDTVLIEQWRQRNKQRKKSTNQPSIEVVDDPCWWEIEEDLGWRT